MSFGIAEILIAALVVLPVTLVVPKHMITITVSSPRRNLLHACATRTLHHNLVKISHDQNRVIDWPNFMAHCLRGASL